MPATYPISLIVGLGNPGNEYVGTRHNMGYDFVDAVATKIGARFREDAKFFGLVTKAETEKGAVWLLKPTTYMNLSGSAVQAVRSYFKLKPEQILVVHDELDLLPGTMKIKLGGGNAGHNGLKTSPKSSAHRTFGACASASGIRAYSVRGWMWPIGSSGVRHPNIARQLTAA